ncbi:MAG: hypothetical protein O7G87_04135 [bacterium]|nr:hypothetical protein [bacterium]
MKWMCGFICFCILGIGSDAQAGAWTQKAGGSYFKLAANHLDSRGDIDGLGKRIPKTGMGQLRDFNIAAYLEYGLADRLTLVGAAPYKRLTDYRTFATGIAQERRSGFGDLELRLRWLALSRGSLVVSAAVGGKIPLWYGEDVPSRVPLSSKKMDTDYRLLVGQSLYPFPGYWTGEVGYRVRGGVFSNEAFYTLEGGVSVGRFLIKGFVAGIQSFGRCAVQEEVELIGDQNIGKLSPGIIYRVNDRIELSLDLIHVMWGCNTTTGSTFSIGVAVKH